MMFRCIVDRYCYFPLLLLHLHTSASVYSLRLRAVALSSHVAEDQRGARTRSRASQQENRSAPEDSRILISDQNNGDLAGADSPSIAAELSSESTTIAPPAEDIEICSVCLGSDPPFVFGPYDCKHRFCQECRLSPNFLQPVMKKCPECRKWPKNIKLVRERIRELKSEAFWRAQRTNQGERGPGRARPAPDGAASSCRRTGLVKASLNLLREFLGLVPRISEPSSFSLPNNPGIIASGAAAPTVIGRSALAGGGGTENDTDDGRSHDAVSPANGQTGRSRSAGQESRAVEGAPPAPSSSSTQGQETVVDVDDLVCSFVRQQSGATGRANDENESAGGSNTQQLVTSGLDLDQEDDSVVDHGELEGEPFARNRDADIITPVRTTEDKEKTSDQPPQFSKRAAQSAAEFAELMLQYVVPRLWVAESHERNPHWALFVNCFLHPQGPGAWKALNDAVDNNTTSWTEGSGTNTEGKSNDEAEAARLRAAVDELVVHFAGLRLCLPSDYGGAGMTSTAAGSSVLVERPGVLVRREHDGVRREGKRPFVVCGDEYEYGCCVVDFDEMRCHLLAREKLKRRKGCIRDQTSRSEDENFGTEAADFDLLEEDEFLSASILDPGEGHRRNSPFRFHTLLCCRRCRKNREHPRAPTPMAKLRRALEHFVALKWFAFLRSRELHDSSGSAAGVQSDEEVDLQIATHTKVITDIAGRILTGHAMPRSIVGACMAFSMLCGVVGFTEVWAEGNNSSGLVLVGGGGCLLSACVMEYRYRTNRVHLVANVVFDAQLRGRNKVFPS
ncbi:unnamed protein product [Amoebophrya sp. A120]|nr:unnamed protein product [Amoebophrya sp. A120]|eukprot:GSA120T00005680001.1